MENGSHNKQESITKFSLDRDVAWTKPLMGWVKANVDAAIFQNQGRIGTGCIVRDSAGAMIMARNEYYGGLFGSKGWSNESKRSSNLAKKEAG